MRWTSIGIENHGNLFLSGVVLSGIYLHGSPHPMDAVPHLLSATGGSMSQMLSSSGRLYEMLDEQEASRVNKEDYVAARVRAETKWGILREFAPQSVMDVTFNDTAPLTYEIIGKAWVTRGNDIVEKRMSLTAEFHAGVWRFSELSESFLHIEKAK